MKTREEVEKLKADWLEDPCYDLYDVEDFEEYNDELLIFQLKHENEFLRKEVNQMRAKYNHFLEVCHDILGKEY